ncbi:MAG TPA: cupin domain-containing protein [Gemmatimonadales bacterium]|nr:cupin domain-containing protein [Gemmatimonadales bacterium]
MVGPPATGLDVPHPRAGPAVPGQLLPVRRRHGDVGISVYLLRALPGNGPGPHRHPYDEVQFVRDGRGLWTVNGEQFEAGAVDVHLSPRFIQENL